MSCYYDRKCQDCTCADYTSAQCVILETTFPECSTLNSKASSSVKVAIDDIYKLVCDIKNNTTLTGINTGCITTSNKELATLIQSLFTKVCQIETTISSLPDFPGCDLNYGNLQDPCGAVISVNSQCEFNQFILDTLNQLWSRVQELESRV